MWIKSAIEGNGLAFLELYNVGMPNYRRAHVPGKQREGRRGVWQRRFWEHTIENEDDFQIHFDYIHYNPVKHRLARCPGDWEASSFHRWVEAGVYSADWASGRYPQPMFPEVEGDYGEGY